MEVDLVIAEASPDLIGILHRMKSRVEAEVGRFPQLTRTVPQRVGRWLEIGLEIIVGSG